MEVDLDHIKGILQEVVKAISGKEYAYARSNVQQLLALLPDDGPQKYETYLEASVADAEFIVRKASKAGSWQAAIAAKRLALESRKELEDRTAKQQETFDPTSIMTDEQIISEFVGMVDKMPDTVLARIDRVIEMRRRPAPQFTVLAGGAE